MGYVYFIRPRNSQCLFKIGYTTRHPAARLRELQQGNHRQLEIYAWIYSPRYLNIKRQFYKVFAKNKHNTWFKIPSARLYSVICYNYSNNFN